MFPVDSPPFSPDHFAALDATGLLDSPEEPEFDQLTSLATRLLHVPVSLVSLVDRNRQFFKSQRGLAEPWASHRETPLSHSFCQHVVASGEPLIISDARVHEMLQDNLAIPDLGVVAYAGVPVNDGRGHVVGALCAIDGKPREWTPEELFVLQALAAQVNTEISLRLRAREQELRVSRLLNGEENLREDLRLSVGDLHAPLDAVILGLQALSYLGELNEAQRECVEICLRDGKTLRNLARKLMPLVSTDHEISSPLLTDCAPHYLVASVLEQLAAAAEARGLRFDVTADFDLPIFRGDSGMIGRALTDLVAYAMRMTPPGGRVAVEAHRADEDGRPAVVFRVIDGAPEGKTEGLPQTHLPFCRQVAHAHGGRLWLDPASGHECALFVPIGR